MRISIIYIACFVSSASLPICGLNDADDIVETTTAEVSAF